MSSAKAASVAANALSSGLLPNTTAEFHTREYWSTFFQNCGRDAFEWYGEWCNVARNCIHALGPPNPELRVLVVGCGNSGLSRGMCDAGYRSIVNIDFDGPTIAEMRTRNAAGAPSMTWLEMDACDMSLFDDGSFDAVIDKGTLDAMCSDDSAASSARVTSMVAEIARVLRPGGKYLVITLGQAHVLSAWCDALTGRGAATVLPAGRNIPWASLDVAGFLDGDVRASPLCPLFIVAGRAQDVGSTSDTKQGRNVAVSSTATLPTTVHVPSTLAAAPPLAPHLRAGAPQLLASLLSLPLPVSEATHVVLRVGGESDPDGESPARTLQTAVAPVRWHYDTVRSLTTIERGHYVNLDVWEADAVTPVSTSSASASSTQTRPQGSLSRAGSGGGARGGVASRPAQQSSSLIVTPAGVRPYVAGAAIAAGGNSAGSTLPRFNVTVVDVANGSSAPSHSAPSPAAAVLLVPRGREHEYSFANRAGQLALAEGAGGKYGRFIFVTTRRSDGASLASSSTTSKAVQDALTPVVLTLVPRGANGAPPTIDFLAVSEPEHPVAVVGEGVSDLSGPYVIEDTAADDDEPDVDGSGDGGGGDDEDDGVDITAPASSGRRSSRPKKGKTDKRGHRQQPSSAATKATTAVDAATTDIQLLSPYRRALRRLVFLNYRNAVQSEALVVQLPPASRRHLTNTRGSARALAAAVDYGALAFEYHRAMAAAALVLSPSLRARACAPSTATGSRLPYNVAIIGLGGGGLAMFFAEQLSKLLEAPAADGSNPVEVADRLAQLALPERATQETSLPAKVKGRAIDVLCVELDPAMLEVATKHFGFRRDVAGSAASLLPSCRVHIGDGYDFVLGVAQSQQLAVDLLVVDVDSKDVSGAMTFPPAAFVSRQFLEATRVLLQRANGGIGEGVLLLNVACRDSVLLHATVDEVVAVFCASGGAVYIVDVGGDSVNYVVAAVAARSTSPATIVESDAQRRAGDSTGKTRGAEVRVQNSVPLLSGGERAALEATLESVGAAALAACFREFGNDIKGAAASAVS